MSLPLNAPPSAPPSAPRGFALIITIVLVAFLVLILVGLATFTRVETQVADNSQQVAKARQNALMALNLALGQLQKHTGPDQSVTATADLQPLPYDNIGASGRTNDPASGTDLSGSNPANGIDAYWRGSRNRRWTGAWSNGNTAPFERADPAKFNPQPALQSWLVSGNERAIDFTPGEQVTNFTIAGVLSPSASTARFGTAAKPYRLLVGPGTVEIDSAATDTLDRAVVAPEVTITADGLPGLPGPQTIGHYAWWVGDEGVKTRADLGDPYFKINTLQARLDRFQVAQRPAIEVIDSAFSNALDPENHDDSAGDLTDFRARLERIIQPAQLAFLDNAPAFAPALKSHYHDMTVWSRGVLADTRQGGLKADLTYLLSQPDPADFIEALRLTYGDNNVAPSSAYNPAINTVSTLYAELPDNVANASAYNAGVGILGASTTWEQLWSFYNFSADNNNAFDSSGAAKPRRHTPTQHGIHPIIVQAKLFYRLRIVGGTPDADGVNRSGTIYVDTIPQAVLANPYAVDLAPADYQLVITGAGPSLRFGSTDTPADVDAEFATRAYASNEPTYNGRIRLVLKSQGIPAGEARVFTIDPSSSVNSTIDDEGRIPVVNGNDSSLVYMKPEFDPVPALTFNTGRKIPTVESPEPPFTRAALRTLPAQLNTMLYMDNDAATAADHQKLIQFIRFQNTSEGLTTGNNALLIVNPLADGVRQGGGFIMVVTQPPTEDNPVTSNPVRFFSHHQAPFYQLNYRGLTSIDLGSPASGVQGLVETGRTFTKNGSNGRADDTPNDWLAANLLRRGSSFSDVRWGLVNIGEGSEQTVPPASIGGASASDVGFVNFLYDIPRKNRPIRSLGQLQHLSPSGFIPPSIPNFQVDIPTRTAIGVHGWQVNYPVSNSYPHPRVRREHVFGALKEHGYHYDGSYLWNQVLWDRFHFSTYPQSGAFDFDTQDLPNSRYRPFRDKTITPWNEPEFFRGDGNSATAVNSRLASKNLLFEGAFNINSTSVEAWKALFSSLRNVQVGTHTGTSGPFSRTLTPAGGTDSPGERGRTPESWNGFRDLSPTEIELLAEEMVLQIRKRGPFLSLADFVNRRLILGRTTTASSANDPLDLGLAGALQAALDRAVNLTDDIHPEFRVQAKRFVREEGAASNANHNAMRDNDYQMQNALVGHPGHVLQGDILSSLGPSLSARSDTFTIRTYGDSVNPATGDVTGRAWCEAVVQRLPDYVRPETLAGGNDATDITGLHPDNQTFGRRYQIVSFRWLGPEDI